jgi:hypothetical protein
MPVPNRAHAAQAPDPLAPSSGTWAATLAATAIALAVPTWHGPVASRFVLVLPRSQGPAALCGLSSRDPYCSSVATRPGGPFL